MAQEQRQFPDASLYSQRPNLALNRILDALRGMCSNIPNAERQKPLFKPREDVFFSPKNQIFLPGGGRAALSFFEKYFIIFF